MDISGHIKALGEHPVQVRLHQDVRAEVVVVVVPTGGEPASAAVAKAPAAEAPAEVADAGDATGTAEPEESSETEEPGAEA